MSATLPHVDDDQSPPALAFACSRCGALLATSDELSAHLARHHAGPLARQPLRRIDRWTRPEPGQAGGAVAGGAAAPHAAGLPLGRADLAERRHEAHGAGPARAPRAAAATRAARLSPALLLACAGLVVGAATVSVAYAWAAAHGGGHLPYHLFWLGELLFFVPAAVRLLSRQASRAERLALLALVGLFAYLPKFLRDPTGPLFHDELVHWHQAQTLFATGQVFAPNRLLGIVEYFPGLELLTVQLRHLTGLSTFQTASILLPVLHVLALTGVFFAVERLTHSSWTAGLAALVYALNPSFVFFHSQFSYESLSIVFFIWVVACAAGLHAAAAASRDKRIARIDLRAAAQRSDQAAWLVVGLVLAAGCIVTHHLATYILVSVLALVTAVAALRRHEVRLRLLTVQTAGGEVLRRSLDKRRGGLALTATLVAVVLGGALTWAVLVAPETAGYLGANVVGAGHAVVALVHRAHGARALYAGSPYPSYERDAAFATPLLLGVAALGGLRLLWRHRRTAPSPTIALALFGLLYFAAAPAMLTAAGSEGARRTWGYSYLGLSVLVAPFLAAALLRARSAARRGLLTAAVVAGLVALLVGNVSIQVDAAYRLPGPYVYGSDARSLTPELLATAAWFRVTQGPGQRVVADRDTALAFGSFGDALPAAASTGFPIWQLYFSAAPPSPGLVGELVYGRYRYLVVDRRMARDLPQVGDYFVDSEPGAGTRTTPVPAAALTKFAHVPWATCIYASDDLAVYRLDLAEYTPAPGGSQPAPGSAS